LYPLLSKEENMFKKQADGTNEETLNTDIVKAPDHSNDYRETLGEKQKNTLVKGSKLTGDIIITYDLELYGDVEGNITSEQKSNIVIKGNCKGNIMTEEGSVDIEGQKSKGDIIAGGDIRITGKFSGGKAEAKGTIYVNGEFSGTMEGKEIEIGPGARGKGELLYREAISIARGAKVDVTINRINEGLKDTGKTTDAKVVNMERPVPSQEKKEAKAVLQS
jgi:cytoskeletal protein CcmA (bactofilin family)